MHDAAFARAAVPSPTRILNLPLRPYSVGHSLWLAAADNPLGEDGAPNSSITPLQALEAIWICSHTWDELGEMHRRWLTLLKLWIWRWRRRGLDPAQAAAYFQNYRRAGSDFPPIDSMGDDGRTAGAPAPAVLLQFLMMKMGKTEPQAMDYPLGLGYWHLAVYQELEGRLKISNAEEVEFEEWCRAQDSKVQSQEVTSA
jgi:hypothetical protein